MVFVLSFVNVVYRIDWCVLNHPCTPGVNPDWLWCVNFFYVLLDFV